MLAFGENMLYENNAGWPFIGFSFLLLCTKPNVAEPMSILHLKPVVHPPQIDAPMIILHEIQSLNKLFLCLRSKMWASIWIIIRTSKPWINFPMFWWWVSCQKMKKNNGIWANKKAMCPHSSRNMDTKGGSATDARLFHVICKAITNWKLRRTRLSFQQFPLWVQSVDFVFFKAGIFDFCHQKEIMSLVRVSRLVRLFLRL
jgi:hypothetical protein